MTRRRFFALAAAAAGWTLLTGHAPYRQWVIYRETHLTIITSRDDMAGDALGDRIASIVRAALPDSKAAVGRGPHVQRIASLVATHQADVAVVSRTHASAMFRGEPPFEQYGRIPLRVLVQTDSHQLVCRDDFLPQHAYLITEALMESPRGLVLSVPAAEADVPAHPGAAAYVEGRPLSALGGPAR